MIGAFPPVLRFRGGFRGHESGRDTASSFARAFVIEVMDRHCGDLALTSALACGAEICLVPGIPHDLETIGAWLKHDLYSHLPFHEVADSKYTIDPVPLKLAGPLAG